MMVDGTWVVSSGQCPDNLGDINQVMLDSLVNHSSSFNENTVRKPYGLNCWHASFKLLLNQLMQLNLFKGFTLLLFLLYAIFMITAKVALLGPPE